MIKLFIEEGPNPDKYFKDGPDPEPIKFYRDGITKEECDTDFGYFGTTVPKCLESLFRDGRIIPGNIPEFLKDAVKVKFLDVDKCDLDINIPLLFDLLHRKALDLIKIGEDEFVKKGRDFLISMLQLQPDHVLTLYNLACAESLLNNVSEALAALEKAILGGFSDLEHMLNDTDLMNIRNVPGFDVLIQKMMNLKQSFCERSEECGDKNECCGDKNECCEDKGSCFGCGSSFVEFGSGLSENFEEDYDDIYAESTNEGTDPIVLNYDVFDDSFVFVGENKDKVVEKKEEVVEKKEEVVENNVEDSFADLKLKWDEKVNLIKNMGFEIDADILALILEQNNGDHQQVVNLLLQNSNRI